MAGLQRTWHSRSHLGRCDTAALDDNECLRTLKAVIVFVHGVDTQWLATGLAVSRAARAWEQGVALTGTRGTVGLCSAETGTELTSQST